ncbi:hypothetical protein OH77DRAFT_1517958 [Trametes cingulata]|nr:hypothetical protein OH77DRAFT_1517958 [Trametes cingulata]
MVATFILTRTFAISALFVGAFPITDAAPVPAPVPSLLDTVLIFASRQKHNQPSPADVFPPAFVAQVAKRSCRQQGCLDDRAVGAAVPTLEDAPDLDPDVNADVEVFKDLVVSPAAIDAAVGVETPPVGASSAPTDDRDDKPRCSCRQQGCLRELNRSLEDAQPEDEDSTEQIASVLPDEGHGVDNVKRSCRQQGCLRELEHGL